MEVKGFQSQKQIDRLIETAQHLSTVSFLLNDSEIESEEKDSTYDESLARAQGLCTELMILVSDIIGTVISNDLFYQLQAKRSVKEEKNED